jgi:hypothetical protein
MKTEYETNKHVTPLHYPIAEQKIVLFFYLFHFEMY